MKRVTGCLINLGLMVFSTLLIFVLIEVFLRAGFDSLPAEIQGEIQSVRQVPWSEEHILPPVPFQSSTRYQAHLPPGLEDRPVRWRDARFTFSTRNLPDWEHPVGLRVGEPSWPVDIMAFGDSFTFCWTFAADCWVQRLQSQYGWHVINAGQPGTGPGGQLAMIEEFALPLEPGVVIWQRYDNDLMDDYNFDQLRNRIRGLQVPPSPDPVRPPRGLGQYSALLHLLDNRLNPPPSSSNYEHGQVIELAGANFYITTEEYPPGNNTDSYAAVAYGFERNLSNYQAGIDMIDEAFGAPVVIVMIPYKELVYADYLDGALSEAYLDQMRANREAMRQECETRGWYCLDTLPALQAAVDESLNTGQMLYWNGDFHLAAYGNAVVAGAVRDYLLENDLLEPRG